MRNTRSLAQSGHLLALLLQKRLEGHTGRNARQQALPIALLIFCRHLCGRLVPRARTHVLHGYLSGFVFKVNFNFFFLIWGLLLREVISMHRHDGDVEAEEDHEESARLRV